MNLYEREARLADRVEFGARLVRHGASSSYTVRDKLSPCLKEAVKFLAGIGKPITQVKVMRACQHLEDVDFLTALEKPLHSPVRWVRDQALILVVAPKSGTPGRSDLVAEMGIDLATGTFLSRWLSFVKAITVTHSMRLWMCFILATLCALTSLILLFTGAATLFEAARFGLGIIPDKDIDRSFSGLTLLSTERHRLVQAILTVSTAVLAFRYAPNKLWAWGLGSIPAGLALTIVALRLWQGSWNAFLALIVALEGAWIFLLPIWVIGSLVHFIPLLAYSFVSRRWNRSGYTLSHLIEVGWTACGFDWLLRLCLITTILFAALEGLVLLIYYILLRPIAIWLCHSLGLPYKEGVSELILFITMALMYLFIMILKKRRIWQPGLGEPLGGPSNRAVRMRSLTQVYRGATPRYRRISVATLAGLAGLIYSIVVSPSLIPRLLAAGLVLFILLYLMNETAWFFRLSLGARLSFPPGSWNPLDWKEAFKSSSRYQETLLLRTNHQSLGLKPEEYLKLLIEIESLVEKEPALSTYWDQRDQLEQALRQEKPG